MVPGSFCARYKITRLVYYEAVEGPPNAIWREKEIKNWIRSRQVALIQSTNQNWHDPAKVWIQG